MKDSKDIDPRQTLGRLAEFLDEDLPTDEEAREECAALGVDIPALAARIQANVAAYQAALLAKEEAPRSQVRTRPARAAGNRRRARR